MLDQISEKKTLYDMISTIEMCYQKMYPIELFVGIIHVAVLSILPYKILKYKSNTGLSFKSQALLLVINITRYSNPLSYILIYNTLFKIAVLIISLITVLLIDRAFKATYERNFDTLRLQYLLPIPIFLAIAFNCYFTDDYLILKISRDASIYLEAVAMWPQFYLIHRKTEVEKLVFYYLTGLGMHRILINLSIVYRVCRYYDDVYYDLIFISSGCVQVIPYFLFWYFCVANRVFIISEETSWFVNNVITIKSQHSVHTIKLRRATNGSKESVITLIQED